MPEPFAEFVCEGRDTLSLALLPITENMTPTATTSVTIPITMLRVILSPPFFWAIANSSILLVKYCKRIPNQWRNRCANPTDKAEKSPSSPFAHAFG